MTSTLSIPQAALEAVREAPAKVVNACVGLRHLQHNIRMHMAFSNLDKHAACTNHATGPLTAKFVYIYIYYESQPIGWLELLERTK